MAIKDIFKMIKADRYTQDGREELIKAQEAVTEDVTYKPGDISRKTGLQKQPDGSWAPVKNAPAQKKGLGGKTLTKGAKHYPTVGEYAENGPIEQRMAMQKLLEKNDTESGSGVPTQGSDWMSLPSGTRMTFEGAKEKMAKNNERIETLKKAMEGKSKADNFRLGSELKRLQNENDYISERLPPEQSAPGWRAPGSESDPNTEGSIAWYAQQAKKSPSASGSGLSERAQYSVSQTAAGMSTEALKSHVDKLKNDPATRNSISNPDAMAKAYESELAKRGETVTKMSDLVAQKSRPESAPTGRQPTPEMLEREKMRQSPEAKARRDKLDAEHPRTETGAPAPSQSDLLAKKRQWDAEGGPANEAERAEYDKLKSQIVYKVPDEKSSFATDISRMKKLKEQDPREFSVQLEKLHSKYNTNKWNDLYRKISTDSAPRVLTGDCKIRIKKSK